MRYCIDIDGTICTPTVGRDYHKAEPWMDRIEYINKLYYEHHHITYFTARAMGRFSEEKHQIAQAKASAVLFELTTNQLNEWGAKYHELKVNKPFYDVFIEDKAFRIEEI